MNDNAYLEQLRVNQVVPCSVYFVSLCIWLPAFANMPHFIDLSTEALSKDTVIPYFPRVRSLIERPRVICVFLRLFLRGRKNFKNNFWSKSKVETDRETLIT